MSAGIVFHLLAALAYTVLAVSLWRPLSKGRDTISTGHVRQVCLASAIALHGIALTQAVLPEHTLRLGWALALSAAVCLGMIVFWLESLVMRIDGLLLILLPASALSALLAALFPTGHLVDHAGNEWLRVHLLIALIAYGLITVAALQAMLMTALDRQLHRPVQAIQNRSMLDRALHSMPPLLVQEVLLFRLIWIGFSILTLTVVTGVVVSLRLTGQVLPMDHKTVFTLLSWLTFGGLLVGRYTRGWRGRIALRWTLVGFAFILLAYTGSRFVLDVIL
ncbi:cytochrome c biogenesis protein CcsA [Pusillimonas sp. SM2304]|uniref:cytochrome C assembly family protein n=1 Tax=Pusillimonas sp. SM2304 TaxID=3073241 RepID=UPI002874EB9A|nr:cytochrome c biogenesis protein CcsA [Pusillimonas sp. SM2304]MDS1138938.1 cytochrome c biogenesis protein CcsA [Pusillimonas sp. SM2304]